MKKQLSSCVDCATDDPILIQVSFGTKIIFLLVTATTINI